MLRHFRKFHPDQDVKDYYLNHVERAEEMVVEPDVQMPDSSCVGVLAEASARKIFRTWRFPNA